MATAEVVIGRAGVSVNPKREFRAAYDPDDDTVFVAVVDPTTGRLEAADEERGEWVPRKEFVEAARFIDSLAYARGAESEV